jgi:hypothetical protein
MTKHTSWKEFKKTYTTAPATFQDYYDSLGWWGKFLVNQNPELTYLRWKVADLERQLDETLRLNSSGPV